MALGTPSPQLPRNDAALLSELIARQPAGRALLREFYSEPAIFERDIERIHLRHWLCGGHASRIPEPRDWFVFDVANESIIVVRGRDRNIPIPFGPYLAAAGWIALLWGDDIVTSYLHFAGVSSAQ